MITHEYEEFEPVRQIWTWFIILTLAALTLSWAMVTHMAVPDVARHWDFDVLPDTPGISIYSTLAPPEVSPVPPQIDLPAGSLQMQRPRTSAISDSLPSRDG
jgi:hypothetical protein